VALVLPPTVVPYANPAFQADAAFVVVITFRNELPVPMLFDVPPEPQPVAPNVELAMAHVPMP
jgi:hypothetical protein